jgi:hypothetical protein
MTNPQLFSFETLSQYIFYIYQGLCRFSRGDRYPSWSCLDAGTEHFYQEEGFLQRTVGGSGLGLAICRRIIDNLGGKIWAESLGKDQASKFHFTVTVTVPIS